MDRFADFLISAMQAVGYGICHQIPERCLHYGGRAMPVCARDMGIFLGFATCLAVLLVVYRKAAPRPPSWLTVAFLFLLAAPAVIDGITSYADLRESTNVLRMVTGSLAGTAGAALVFPFVSGALFRSREAGEAEAPRLLEPWWSLPALAALSAALSLAVMPDWPHAFWFWSLALMLAIASSLLALNFTLLTLAIEFFSVPRRMPAAGVLATGAAVMVLFEIAATNRLHWLADKLV